MADITTLNTVYNHFMTTYTPKSISSRYDTHKKSELRSVYNSIVQSSKDSPLFLFDNRQETKAYAIDLKEGARDLKNIISSLSSTDEGNLLSKKTVASSNEDIVSASFVGEIKDEASVPDLTIEVKQLARPQTNLGRFLPSEEVALAPSTYSFDIHSRDMDYEFQFNISSGDTNRATQEKLARLITRSNIGINASIEEDENGMSALKLVSTDTGLRKNVEQQFEVSDNNTSKTSGAVSYFGIGDITEEAQNSSFILNGDEQSTARNHFTIENMYDIALKNTTKENEPILVGLKTDIESLTDNISNLIMGYNTFIQKAAAYVDSQPYSKALIREMGSITSLYKQGFESIGLNLEDNGTISLDKNLLQQTAEEDDAMDRFSNIKSFANNLLEKAGNVSLDPMQYTQKKVVEYKNPGHNFASPYVTSNYSGMLFSSYC